MSKITKAIIGTGLLSCLITISPSFAAKTTDSGESQNIEWSLNQSWSAPTGVVDLVHSLDGKLVFFLTEDNKVKVYTSIGILQGSVPVDAGVTNIDISPQGETLYLVNNKTNEFSSLSIDVIAKVNLSGSPQKGKSDAPVSMVVFTDFECPYCSKLAPMLEEAYKANTDNLLITFKNMPLNFHKYAKKAALAGLAANKQGKFWPFHDEIFALKTLNDDEINSVAKKLELDMAKFKKDMASAELKKQVEKDIAEARKAGVTGTPTVFINGHKLKQRNVPAIQKMIDNELKEAGLL